MFKNVASQKITVYAFDSSTGGPKTGDAANLTVYVSKDDGAATILGDTSATEVDATKAPGSYTFDLTQGETNADKLLFTGKSTTANVFIMPQTIYSTPPKFSTLAIDASGQVTVGAVANNAITDASIAADAEVDIANAVWDALTASHVVANSFGATIGTGASAATIADAVWDELRSGHVAAGSFGEGTKVASGGFPVGGFAAGAITIAAIAAETGLKPRRSGTAQAGAAGTITLDAGASANDQAYLYQLIEIVSGTGSEQGARIITTYTGATKVATVVPNWTTTPDNTSVFAILPSGIFETTAPPTATEIADTVLASDIGSGTNAGALNERTVRAALRWNRNKISVNPTTNVMTVYKEDDVTVAWTGVVSGALATALGMDAT